MKIKKIKQLLFVGIIGCSVVNANADKELNFDIINLTQNTLAGFSYQSYGEHGFDKFDSVVPGGTLQTGTITEDQSKCSSHQDHCGTVEIDLPNNYREATAEVVRSPRASNTARLETSNNDHWGNPIPSPGCIVIPQLPSTASYSAGGPWSDDKEHPGTAFLISNVIEGKVTFAVYKSTPNSGTTDLIYTFRDDGSIVEQTDKNLYPKLPGSDIISDLSGQYQVVFKPGEQGIHYAETPFYFKTVQSGNCDSSPINDSVVNFAVDGSDSTHTIGSLRSSVNVTQGATTVDASYLLQISGGTTDDAFTINGEDDKKTVKCPQGVCSNLIVTYDTN